MPKSKPKQRFVPDLCPWPCIGCFSMHRLVLQTFATLATATTCFATAQNDLRAAQRSGCWTRVQNLHRTRQSALPVWMTRERSKMFARTKDLLAHGSIAWFYAGLPSKYSEVYFQVQKFWLNSKDWKTLLSNANGRQPCDAGCKTHVACVRYTAWYDVLQNVKVQYQRIM